MNDNQEKPLKNLMLACLEKLIKLVPDGQYVIIYNDDQDAQFCSNLHPEDATNVLRDTVQVTELSSYREIIAVIADELSGISSDFQKDLEVTFSSLIDSFRSMDPNADLIFKLASVMSLGKTMMRQLSDEPGMETCLEHLSSDLFIVFARYVEQYFQTRTGTAGTAENIREVLARLRAIPDKELNHVVGSKKPAKIMN